jgi:hypothetical protein
MQLRTSVRIPFPPALVFRIIRDHVVELRPYLEGIHRISVRSREERDGKVHVIVDWCAGEGGVSGPMRALFGEWAFAWTDYATWDADELSVDWRTETRALGGALSCAARDVFVADGEAGTLLEVSGALEVSATRIPGVPAAFGGLVARRLESYLVDRIETSVARTAQALAAYLSDHTPSEALGSI